MIVKAESPLRITSWLIGLVSGMTLGVACLGGSESARKLDMTTSAQKTATALLELAQAVGIQIIIPEGLGSQSHSPALVGEFTLEQALDRLLSGTGLDYHFVSEHMLVIKLRPIEIDEDLEYLSSGSRIEELIVTAQKRQQDAFDVPMSLSAFSGEKLVDMRIDNMLDLSFATPSMHVQEIGPGRQAIVIRGVASGRGSSSLTGVYLDEMPVAGVQDGFIPAYIDLRTTDLERVEVLKGPQGTLFGEGSVGGTVRFVTRDPDLDRYGGYASGSFYNSEDGGWSKELEGVVNLPLVENALAMRLAVLYEDSAGWIDQPSRGRSDINDSEVNNIRAKFLWSPSDALSLRATALVHRNSGGGSNIVNMTPRSDSNFIQPVDALAPTGYRDEYELFNVTAVYEIGDVSLLSSTSKTHSESLASLGEFSRLAPVIPEHPEGGDNEVLLQDYKLDASIFSQELRLTSETGPLSWIAGGFYKHSEFTRVFISGIDVRQFGVTVFDGAFAGREPSNDSRSWAVFFDASYNVNEHLEIGGGVRAFEDRRDAFDDSISENTAIRTEETFEAVTARAYVSHKTERNHKVYFSAAEGFRSGGFNNDLAVERGAPPAYDPENTISYELGTKLRLLDGALTLDAAIFYSKYSNVLEDSLSQSPVDDKTVQFTANNGEARLRGMEWSLQWMPSDRWVLSASGDVIDTEIVKINETLSNNPSIVGDPLPTPKYSLTLGVVYQFNGFSGLPGFARVDYNRVGVNTFTIRGAGLAEPQRSTPEADFLHMTIGAQVSHWDIRLFGHNLLNEDDSIRASVTGIDVQARPRTLGLSFSRHF